MTSNPLALFLILLVLLSSSYCVMVCVCVAGRMTRATRASIRWPVLALGAIAFFAILRTLEGHWYPGADSIVHGITVTAGALILAVMPRIQT